jgi:hypothetical protein
MPCRLHFSTLSCPHVLRLPARLSVAWRTLPTLHTATHEVRECIKRALKCQSFYTTMKFNSLLDDRFIASALFNSTYIDSDPSERRREEERRNIIGVYRAWDRDFDNFRRHIGIGLPCSCLLSCFSPFLFLFFLSSLRTNILLCLCYLPLGPATADVDLSFRRGLRRSKRRIVVISFRPNVCADIRTFTDSCTDSRSCQA